MTTKNAPHIKSVTASKEGRFWAVKVDGRLLAIVLYRNGALAVQQLIQRLAGLPVDEPEAEKPVTKPQKPKAAEKKPKGARGKAAIKAQPTEAAPEPATATPNA